MALPGETIKLGASRTCKACGVTVRTIERHIADGRIKPAAPGHSGPGAGTRFTADQVGSYKREYRKKCHAPPAQSPGSTSEATSTTPSGTTRNREKLSAVLFARMTREKREIASRHSSPKALLPSLEDLLA